MAKIVGSKTTTKTQNSFTSQLNPEVYATELTRSQWKVILGDEAQIRDQASIHVSQLLNSSSPPISISDAALFDMVGPLVTAIQEISLSEMPSSTEIREVVFGIKRLSSPSPDGF